MLNMFRTLMYPSSGACNCSVELPHWSYCSWFDVCWSFSVVGLAWYPCCRLQPMVYVIQVCWQLSQAVSKPLLLIPLLCVQWKTPDDGQRNCLKHLEFYSKNKFENLVHLVGFIIGIYHDARSPECQIHVYTHIVHWILPSNPLTVSQIGVYQIYAFMLEFFFWW